MRIPYTYSKDFNGQVINNELETNVVKLIFQRYLDGDSLGKIVVLLSEKEKFSHSSKEV